jgi:phosphate-selective porin OprO/OprP
MPPFFHRRLMPLVLVCVVAFAAAAPLGAAGQAISFGLRPGDNLAERTDELGLVYRNENHPIIQELWSLGRYHGQYHSSNGSAGDDDGWEDRRFRAGFQARLLEKLTVHAQAISGSDFRPSYNGFTELWIGWQFSDAVTLTVGQQKHRFTHDRNISSRYIQTLERTQLVNMFAADYTPAITLSGRVHGWQYYGGIFSDSTGRDWDAMTEFHSGASLLLTATHDVRHVFTRRDTAHFNFSVVHSEPRASATNLNRFENGFATALILTEGPASLVAEATVGLGAEAGDAYGFYIQPGYFVTRKLQLVGRYQLAFSDGDLGLLPQSRYERPAGLPPGDRYRALYAGMNYHFADHRIKLLTGVEYADMGGEHTVTASVAIRMFWGPHSRGPFPMATVLPPRVAPSARG